MSRALFTTLALTLTTAHAVEYPETRRDETVVDVLHGTKVADPYRWLEDDNSDETAAWVTAQNKVTRTYLDAIPARDRIQERLTELWNYERYGTPYRVGDRYFFSRNTGLQNQSVQYVTDSLDAEPRVLLDPNTLSEDGTVALSGWSISEDGKHLAYSISRSGSDWKEWKVRDIATGKDLDDHVQWSKFSGAAWAADGSGFYYSRYDEPKDGDEFSAANFFHKVYFHKVGTAQKDDHLVYQRPDQKKWNLGGFETDDGQFLLISASDGAASKNAYFYQRIGDKPGDVTPLLPDFDAQYSFIGNEGDTFWFKTDLDAPRGRIVAIDINKPQPANWKTLIPQSKDTLRGANIIADQFVATYMHDAHTQVKRFSLKGEPLGEITLPGIGNAGGFRGERDHRETFYSFESFTTPDTIYRYDFDKNESTLYRAPKLEFDTAQFETKQVFYPSKDGTKIPMFIVAKKGLKLDGTNPTLLYAYGGFDISLLPRFSTSNIAWLEMGGVYAVANLRGGGEYGEEWHEAGMLMKKQNVFDDFIAAAEWLIAEDYTSSEKIAIAGGSNGGLLVGACMTQRPELFKAALPAVGVLDMLRYHKFTIGWAWATEYGSADESKEMFDYLHGYSPLHNLKPRTNYPATMITTGDHDDRVVPAHSFKFAAALQHAHASASPVLIRIETKAGHGAGKPTDKIIAEAADKWAFLVKELGL